MRRLAVLSLPVTVVSAAGALAATPAGFEQGVAAGEVSSTSARLWTRAPGAGRVTLTLVEAQGSRPRARTIALQATTATDLTVQRVVGGLRPATRYRYVFSQAGGTASAPGLFTTALAPNADATVRFAVSGDADATAGANGKPGFNGFETYGRMAAEANDFNVNLGDTIYSDSELAGSPPALTRAQKWEKYRLGLALAPLRRLRAGTALYSHWDDHEFVNDFTRAEHGAAIYTAGMQAFRDYAPVSYTSRTGLYRTVRWGRNLELFFLDERSFRSSKATLACAGDLAPTAPAAVRQAFTALAPALAQPVPQTCLDALADPTRTMLGAAQYRAFVRAIRSSEARWKVVLNEVPLMQLYALPYDRWEGYGAERARLLADLSGVENVVVLTTDAHAHLIGPIRTSTVEAGGPVSTGIWEVVTGPVATNTYAREIDAFLGAAGSGDFVTSLFFKPAPPRGLGLRCAATDAYGYAQVTVTATTLRIQPKAAGGGPVVEKTGGRCLPLVLRAS
ncbi:MAG: alkaline phosphatase D family protein [Gaiella sp.]